MKKKTDFDNRVSSLHSKITANKTKNESIENEFKKLRTFDSSYFRDKSHFEEDGTRNYLIFQPVNRYFKVKANTLYISEWKSKRLSDESIKPSSTSDNSLSLLIDYLGSKIILKFIGRCLKPPKLQCTINTIVKIYIVVELDASSSFNDDPTL